MSEDVIAATRAIDAAYRVWQDAHPAVPSDVFVSALMSCLGLQLADRDPESIEGAIRVIRTAIRGWRDHTVF